MTRWNSIIYPNCSFMSQFRHLRIVHPVAVDRTVVHTYSFRLKGAPEQMFRDTVAFANVVDGTASWVLTDDLEVYGRLQKGLSAQASDWVYLGRGFGGDVDDTVRRAAQATWATHTTRAKAGKRAAAAPAPAKSTSAPSSPHGRAI